jgi:hypothetical protein
MGLLCSPTYIARPVVAGDDAHSVLERERAHWPPLVTNATWTAVHDRLAQPLPGRPRQAASQYLLTSFLRCAQCGCNMVGVSTPRGDQPGVLRRSYRCTSWAKGANRAGPVCFYQVAQAPADATVIEQVSEVLAVLSTGGQRLRKAWQQAVAAERSSSTERERRRLRKDLDEIATRLVKASEMYVDGKLDKDAYNALREANEQRKSAAEQALVRLEQTAGGPRRGTRSDPERILAEAEQWSNVFRDNEIVAQRDVLSVLIEHIVIGRAGYRLLEAEITWTPTGRLLRELADA